MPILRCALALVLAAAAANAAELPPLSLEKVAPPPKPLSVGTMQIEPFIIQRPDGSWTGISIELWKRVAAEVGVPYEIKEIPFRDDAQFYGQIQKMDAFVSMNVSHYNEERLDMSHPFFLTGLAIVTRVQPAGGLQALVSGVLSWSFLEMLGVLALVLLGAGAVVWRIERNRSPEEFGGPSHRGFFAGVFWSVEALVGAAGELSKTRAARTFRLVWTLVCLVGVSGLTAKLASDLTVSELGTGISGPDDLGKVRVGATAGSMAEDYLKSRGVRSIPFSGKSSADLEQMLQALDRGEVDAVVGEAPVLQYWANRKFPARLKVLPGIFHPHGYGIALPHGSKLLKNVNVAVLKVVQSEDWKKELSSWLGTATD